VKLPSLSLKAKVINSFFIVVFISLISMGLAGYFNSKDLIQNSITSSHSVKISSKLRDIENHLKTIKDDLNFMTNLPAVAGSIRARDNDGIDKTTNSSYNQWISRFNNGIKSLMVIRPTYESVSLFDEEGYELARVGKTKEDGLHIFSIDDLLEEVSDAYFERSLKLKRNEVYASTFTFIKDNEGKVVKPKRAILNTSMNVRDPSEKVRGFVLIKIKASSLFSGIGRAAEEGANYYVLNSNGYFLHHTNIEKQFGHLEKEKKDKTVKMEFLLTDEVEKQLQSYNANFEFNKSILFSKSIKFGDNSWRIFGSLPLSFIDSKLTNMIILFSTVILVALVFSIAIAYFISNSISKSLISVTSDMAIESEKVSEVSTNIASNSDEISRSVTTQAEAIEQTSASLEEITQMNRSNLSNVSKSIEQANNSKEIAINGQKVITNMIETMKQITQSINQLRKQIDENSTDMEEIKNMISEISLKTQMINEIVFQTKLLSFNASVEAARAGEHGRGFAVVAEEVGKLANSSGAASKEISELITNSVKKVEMIVENSSNKMNALFSEGEAKVLEGSNMSKECGDVLESIVSHANGVVENISTISRQVEEQTQGVDGIGQAMIQLEEGTTQNSEIAKNGVESVKVLEEQSVILEKITAVLEKQVYGKSKKEAPAVEQESKAHASKKSFKQNILNFKFDMNNIFRKTKKDETMAGNHSDKEEIDKNNSNKKVS